MPNTGNPFYIEPLGGYAPAISQGLAGIGATFEKRRDEKKLLARSDAAKTAMQEALQTGDSVKMRQVAIDYPEVTEQMQKAFGFTNDATKAVVASAYSQVLSDPANAQRYLAEGAKEVERLGGNPVNMSKDIIAFGKDPQGAFKSVELRSAVIAPELHKAYMEGKKAQKPTTLMQNLQAAGLQPGTAEYQQAIMGYIKKPSGSTITIGDARTLEKATEGQLAAAGFADRLNNANSELDSIMDEGYDPTDPNQKIAGDIPLVGNYLVSDKHQQYQNAKSDFITAVLRKESGAVISEEEFKREDSKYFPKPGDTKKTIEVKRKRRERQANIQDKQSKGVYGIQYEKPSERTVPVDQMSDEELMKGL